MIDLTNYGPPYYVRGDWNGSDAGATNNTNGLKQAILDAQASNTNGGLVDAGGTQGDSILLPKGSIMFDDTLVLGDGVAFHGAGDYATNLILKSNFDPNKKGIVLGSPNDAYASFGGRLQNLCVSGRINMPAAIGVPLVYSNDVQDGFLLDHVRLYGFNRRWFHGEKAYGGGSMVRFRQVTGNCSVPDCAGGYFNYPESTMVEIDGCEPSGARVNPSDPDSPSVPGTVGIGLGDGSFDLKRIHGEVLETALLINLHSPRSYCDVSRMTGGPMTRDTIVIVSNPVQSGHITLERIKRNGEIRYTLLNGNGSNLSGDIDAKITV